MKMTQTQKYLKKANRKADTLGDDLNDSLYQARQQHSTDVTLAVQRAIANVRAAVAEIELALVYSRK